MDPCLGGLCTVSQALVGEVFGLDRVGQELVRDWPQSFLPLPHAAARPQDYCIAHRTHRISRCSWASQMPSANLLINYPSHESRL